MLLTKMNGLLNFVYNHLSIVYTDNLSTIKQILEFDLINLLNNQSLKISILLFIIPVDQSSWG